MMLVIGAMASGKLDYVRSLGYGKEDISDGVLDGRPVLYNLQDIVFANPAESPALFAPLMLKEVVVCNEVGSGVIPVDARGREAREACGRLCNRLAANADRVVRLVCGIPVALKG